MTNASLPKLNGGLTVYASEGATINITIELGGGFKPSEGKRPDNAHCQREGLFAAWLGEEVDTSLAEGSEQATSLYRAYQAFCDRRGVPACCIMSHTRFGRELGARGFEKLKNGGGRIERVGLRLRAERPSDAQGVAVGDGIEGGEPGLPLQGGE